MAALKTKPLKGVTTHEKYLIKKESIFFLHQCAAGIKIWEERLRGAKQTGFFDWQALACALKKHTGAQIFPG